MHYDVIGDLHGGYKHLVHLFRELDYRCGTDGCYRHPERMPIFVGDFIDRGSQQRETVELVRRMVEDGIAKAVIGNHEFNAVCYAVPDGQGDYVRPHNDQNNKTHAAFLEAYPFGSAEHLDTIAWFRTLPLFIDLPHMRVVHACWSEDDLAVLKPYLTADNRLKNEAYMAYADKDSDVYRALEIVLKGPEQELPESLFFNDRSGLERTKSRVRWWMDDDVPASERLLFMGVPLGDDKRKLADELSLTYQFNAQNKPVFIGHYSLKSEPDILQNNVICVDYGSVKPEHSGGLVAYRYDRGAPLSADHFVRVGL